MPTPRSWRDQSDFYFALRKTIIVLKWRTSCVERHAVRSDRLLIGVLPSSIRSHEQNNCYCKAPRVARHTFLRSNYAPHCTETVIVQVYDLTVALRNNYIPLTQLLLRKLTRPFLREGGRGWRARLVPCS